MGVGVPGLGNVAGGHHGHEQADRDVDQEDRPPGDRLDQVAAEQRAERRGDAAEPRPRPDRPGPVALPEARLDHRQAARGEQGAADALQQPGGDQRVGARGDRAEQRRRGEPGDADHEDPPPAVAIPERPTEQDQGGEGEQVAVQDPLQGARLGSEVLADARQGDVDDGAVEKDDAGAEHRDREHPAARPARICDSGALLPLSGRAQVVSFGRWSKCRESAKRRLHGQ